MRQHSSVTAISSLHEKHYYKNLINKIAFLLERLLDRNKTVQFRFPTMPVTEKKKQTYMNADLTSKIIKYIFYVTVFTPFSPKFNKKAYV